MVVLTVEAIAIQTGGTVIGDPGREIRGAAPLSKAGPDEITFLSGEKPLRAVRQIEAGACFLSASDAAAAERLGSLTTVLLVEDPQDAFVAVLKRFRPQRPRPRLGVSPQAFVSPTATIGSGTNIFPGAYVGDGAVIGERCDIFPGAYVGQDCRIGDDCILHPQAVLYANGVLGSRVTVHASAVVGADGFGYRMRQGRYDKVPQLGWVEVEDDVEIGAGTTIDRGAIGPTRIGEGTKLDNLVMIGHNCEIGRHNAFASQVGLAGSVTTGDYVRCAGQVGIADHVHLGAHSTFGAKAGVHKDMPQGKTYVGIPALEESEALRVAISLPKVPDLRKQVRRLEAELESLRRRLEAECERTRDAEEEPRKLSA